MTQNLINDICLRPMDKVHLDVLFEFHRDPKANHMAAFTVENPADHRAFIQKMSSILANPDIDKQVIYFQNQIVGSLMAFSADTKTCVCYWLDRHFWHKGIATQSLKAFLQQYTKRPLFAQVAADNQGSIRVLQKSGFVEVQKSKGFANSRQSVIEELLFQLNE